MRRLRILFFWITGTKNNVGFMELVSFLLKPTLAKIASKYIDKIEKKTSYEVSFKTIPNKLFWPIEFDKEGIHQVVSETFDTSDWHYYRKKYTEVEAGEILLDIGAAEGLFSLVVADQCDKIFLVEPNRLFNKCLEKTFESFEKKVTIHKVAVGDEDGMINFNEASLSGMVEKNKSETDSSIPVKKIDSIIPPNQKITYLKADIEGFEYNMLKGAEITIKNNKPKIAITTYHTENNPEEIINLILSYVPEYQYYVKGIFEQGPKPVMIHFWIN
ncbi:FkbM family methyltransferase [Seonamhaeicola sp. ML3]|uniref:FkbM family methyltransferase n=1 Tax=Seonamhaeicola sp. ML3 TaxID=2937786 RepID=UPI00200DA827|nr:FkbM family methyltransferase [Seonamhaeicola sp. ML3]